VSVAAGGNLQAAINAAKPGDTILVQAGATFDGTFILPAKGGTTYITIRSSAPDASFPPPGERITPAFSALMPKIRSTHGGPAIRMGPGASYWRLMFLEFLPSSVTSTANLIELGSDSQTLAAVPHHVTIDRCYAHGDPGWGQRRGIALNSGDTQVINSYFSDFKMALQDTQAIGGWNGPGPYLIENNYIEAAAENIMFGGSDPSIANLVPSDITIRRNHITKPLAWRTQSWTIKNLIELKNAQNVLVEGNIIEHNWASGQQGYAILLGPRNQYNTAPWTVVKNVTFQNNIIRRVASVFNISGYDNLAPSQQTENIKIRNNLVYDVSTAYFTPGNPAAGLFALIGNGPKDITIDHNTVNSDGSSTIYLYGGASPTGVQVRGFVLTNNLLRDNLYGVFGDGYGKGTAAFNVYTPNAIVLRNAFAGGAPQHYPTGNTFPTLAEWLGDFLAPGALDYRLTPSSVSRNAALDGRDVGVDFVALNAALSGTAPPPLVPAPGAGTSTPYTGTPAAVPGTIQIENFDNGGPNVAYRDLSAGNAGAAYRSTDVDITGTNDTGGGHIVGWVSAGEWLAFTATVANAGTYTVEARVASSGPGGTFHLEAQGIDKTGALTVPNTGGWDIWTTVSKTGITLAAGSQVLRVVMDTAGPGGAVGNFNWVRLTQTAAPAGVSTPYTGTPIALPGTIQTENFDNGGPNIAYRDLSAGNEGAAYRTTDVDIVGTGDTGGGHLVGWVAAGEWLAYTANVSTPGTFTVDVRVASNGAGGTFHVEVNGVNTTGVLTVPNTGGWDSWATVTKTGVSLAAGPQVLRVVMDTAAPGGAVGNFNWIRLTQTAVGSTPYTGTPVALPGTIQMENFDNGGPNVAYRDLSPGNEGGAYRTTDVDIVGTGDTGGGHLVGWVAAGEWLAYTANVSPAGTYSVDVRVASNGAGGTFHIEVNGVNKTGALAVPNTGGWDTWTTVTKAGVSLAAGPQVFRIVMDTAGPGGAVANFNWVRVR
jgi:SOS-response transcriptional repressor LexA